MLKKYVLPSFLIVICLALLLGGAGFFYFLTQYDALHPAKNIQVSQLAVVALDGAWASETFASETPEEQQAAIDASLAQVQAMGGNAVALTARMPNGDALWRDKTETLATYATITKTDHFFAKFDAFDVLIDSASARGIEVILIPTAADNTTLTTAELATLPNFLAELCERYTLRFLTVGETTSDYNTYLISSQNGDTISAQGTDSENEENHTAQIPESSGAISTNGSTIHEDAILYDILANPESLALAFTQSGTEVYLMLGEYSALATGQTPSMQLFEAYYAAGKTLPDLAPYLASDYARTLAVTYPTEDGSAVENKNLFLMGTSNPAEVLTLNGEAVPRYGTEGVWGILLTLSKGENTFVLANGAETLDYTVHYQYESDGGNGGGANHTTYQTLPEGQTIQILPDIASALSNAYNAGTITQTLYQGAVLAATRYVTTADGTTPYAYQLTTGDWVRASYCELHDTSRTSLSEAVVNFDDETRASVLTFAGGTPAVYHTWEGNTLTLTLMTADYAGRTPTADWFDCSIGLTQGKDTVLSFTFSDAQPLYGWAVNYDSTANTTTITLKQQPTLNTDGGLPLKGVRVLLDAGHGGEALGAMGAAGISAPCEKDVNLALTMATKYFLENLGATVLLTRADDSEPTLGDRVTALNTLHPDFFISVHHNSLELTRDMNEATGVEAYWFYDEGEAFANDLIANVSNAAARNLRSANYGYYYVTRSNICPATLLEVGFMTNPWEYEQIANTDTIWAEAAAITQTIYNTVAANG